MKTVLSKKAILLISLFFGLKAKLNLENEMDDLTSEKLSMEKEFADEKTERDKELHKCLPIHDAAHAGNFQKLQTLLHQKTDINAIACFWQMTPIQYVIFKNGKEKSSLAIETVAWLLQHGASNLEHKDYGFSRTALHLAAMYDQPEIINLLMRYGAKGDAEDLDSMTPLHLAAQYNNRNAAEALINNGVSINIQRKDPDLKDSSLDGLSLPIHIAAYSNSINILDFFVNTMHQDINIQDATGNTPLHYAAVSLKTPSVKWLLDNGADKTIRDFSKKTALNQVAAILKSIYDKYKQNQAARENRSAFQNFLQDSITENQKNLSKKLLASLNITYPEEIIMTSEDDIRNHPVVKLLLPKK